MRQKMICVLLAAIMVLGLLAGCSGDGGNKGTSGNVGTRSLTVGLPQNVNITDYKDNAFTKYLEENLNIELEFVYFSSSSADYKKQLTMMASANETLPDVLLGFWDLSRAEIEEYGEAGYFLELNDLLEEHGHYFWEAYNREPEATQQRITRRMTSFNGSIYTMPLYCIEAMDDIQSVMYINKDWLEKVGKEIPTTTGELYDVLKAFATQDPNGNGILDEIPFLANNIYGALYPINAYVYFDLQNYFNVTDGKLWAPFTTDEYREALIYCNKLCSEGLLSELSFTTTATSELKSMITPANGTALVGIFYGHPAIYMDSSSPLVSQYTALPALEDATGEGGYNVCWPTTLNPSCYITKDCQNPELAMEFLDFFYKDETVTRQRHGEKDVDWKEATGMSAHQTEAFFIALNEDAFFRGNSTWGRNGAGILTAANYFPIAADNDVERLIGESYALRKDVETPEELATELPYTGEEYEVRAEYNQPLKDYIVSAMSLFITGAKDPSSDAEWKTYLDTINGLGFQDLLEISQSAYDRMTAE